MTIGFQELYFPQLFKNLGVEHQDFRVSIVSDDPVLRVVGDSIVAIVTQNLSFGILSEVERLEEPIGMRLNSDGAECDDSNFIVDEDNFIFFVILRLCVA